MKEPVIAHNRDMQEFYFEERCHLTEWWNSAKDEDASIARARVEPSVTTRLHRLEGITERYVILEGQAMVRVGTQPPTTVAPGDVVIIPPGVAQQISNTEDTDLVFLAICTPRFTEKAYEDIDT